MALALALASLPVSALPVAHMTQIPSQFNILSQWCIELSPCMYVQWASVAELAPQEFNIP
jgi:hypothetical protein